MTERRKSKLSIINNIMKPISPPRRRQASETSEEPTKIARNFSIPPPLTFPPIPRLEGMSDRSFDCSNRGIRLNLSLSSSKCAFCEELLSAKLAGELDLQLSCSHFCHRYCYLAMMDKNHLDALPICTQCGRKAKCVDASIQSDLTSQKLAEEQVPYYLQPSTRLFGVEPLKISDNIVKSAISTCESQLLSPVSTPSSYCYNETLYNEVLKPRILVTLDHANHISNGEFEVDCLINVKPPQISDCISSTSGDHIKKSSIVRDMKIKLALNITNWEDSVFSLNELGDLLMFDYLEISSNGSEWDSVCLYFFHCAILLVDYKGTHLMGQVFIQRDISSINRICNEITLNLRNEALPELYIKNNCSLIILKWEFYLAQALNGIDTREIPLLHTTSNAWDLIEDSFKVDEGLEFNRLIEENLDVPTSLLTKMMPPSEKIPLNINLAISLINTSGLNNLDYKERITSFLQKTRSMLRSIDSMGIIFIGIDCYGRPYKSGTFIGCANASWDGWDNIIRDIRIFSNYDDRDLPILDNGFEEMLIGFNKCKQLLPYIPSVAKNNSRLIILNSSDYGTLDCETNIISKVKDSINCLLENENLTIDIVRIGKYYSKEVQEIYAILSAPVYYQDSLTISTGSKLLRFESFSEFDESFDFIMEYKLQSEYMPYVIVELEKEIGIGDTVSFSEIEINGEMEPISQNMSKLKLIFKNVFPFTQRNIMMKFKLNLSDTLNKLKNILEYRVVNYQNLWIGFQDEPKYLNTALCERNSPRILFSNDSDISGSPLDQIDGNSYFVDIPLLPPLSSSKDQVFARRKTELAIIKSLKSAEYSSVEETENLLSHLISLVFGIIRGFEGVSDEPYFPLESKCNLESWKSFMLHFKVFNNNQRYIQCLVDDLESINRLFKLDSSSALVKCQDLANWIT